MARMNDFGRLMALGLLVATAFTHSLAHNTRGSDVPILVGCFSTSEPLSNQGTYKYQSSGYCSGICTSRNQGVVGLSNGNVCWCGDFLPPENTKVLDERCDTPCQGYGLEDCGGGTYYFTVWLTGLESNVPNYKPEASSSVSSTTTSVSSTQTSMPTTTSESPSPTSKPTPLASSSNSGEPSEKKLAIILASVFGVVAFAVMAVLFCCLWRRRKRTGSFRRGRSPDMLTSLTRPDSAASSVPEATIYVTAGSRKWEGRISRTPATPHRSSQPTMAFNPGAREPEDRSRSEDNSFYTPQATGASSMYSNNAEPAGEEFRHEAELEHNDPVHRTTSTISAQDFAQQQPTPFAPTMVQPRNSTNTLQRDHDYQLPKTHFAPYQTTTSSNITTVQPQDSFEALQHNHCYPHHENPFTSSNDENDEAADAISPMAPVKSLERIRPVSKVTSTDFKNFPMVHYPSWSEVSDFDFAGADGGGGRKTATDGWHPWRERKDGRYELA